MLPHLTMTGQLSRLHRTANLAGNRTDHFSDGAKPAMLGMA
jgi:hypothetical protein